MKNTKINEASMNISMNGADAKEVAELIGILKNAGVETHIDMPMAHDAMHTDVDSHNAGDADMAKLKTIMSPEPSCGMEEEEVEEWENSPEGSEGDPEYKDQHYMTKDLSGGINKSKKSYPPVAGGDNPMALEGIKKQLLAALEEKKKSPAGGPACWTGKKIHPTKPTKMKNGKRVNNCIDADSSDGK